MITYSGQTEGRDAGAFGMSRAAQTPSPASHQRIILRRSSGPRDLAVQTGNTTGGTTSTAPSRPTATVEPVGYLAWTSSATSVAWVPSAVTVRLM